MIRFLVFSEGKPAKSVDLSAAYLFGSDGVPLRAEIEFKNGTITCTKSNAGPAGLALLWPVDGVGTILLETMRLHERDAPFVLGLELARCQLMRIHHKSEDWGLFDCPDSERLNAAMEQARDLLIEAIKADKPARISLVAHKALGQAVKTAEDMARYHAGVLLDRRGQTAGFGRHIFGCHVELGASVNSWGPLIRDAFDLVTVPIPWKQVEPNEQSYNFKAVDTWVDWLAKHRIPVKGSPLVCFQEHCVPDWLYIWEHDFETVRDLVAEHVRRVISRYANRIQVWDVISGIHANQTFGFNFEQLIELTRVAASVTKQIAPRCLSIIDIVAPWGEYYARNQRTIPPMLYAEMAVQSGINFDAFGLQFCLAADTDGMYARDMFQISSLIDKFGAFGKPIHVTAVQIPSHSTAGGGTWGEEWTEAVQSRWLREFYSIALSKPFVETVSWRNLVDGAGRGLPTGGLVQADLSPKPAYDELAALRKEILPDAAAL